MGGKYQGVFKEKAPQAGGLEGIPPFPSLPQLTLNTPKILQRTNDK